MSVWNFTIDDASPFLTYTPYGDGFGLTKGWTPWYTESGFNQKPGDTGVGSSYHMTSANAASVTVQFNGTGVFLYGLTNSSYEVTVDSVTQTNLSPVADVLYSNANLPSGMHNVTLIARPSSPLQQLAFDRIIVSSPLQDGEQQPTSAFYDNSNTTAFTYSGNWSVASAFGIPNTTSPAPYHTTSSKGAAINMSFSGGNAVAVNGMSNWGNWLYSVTLDGVTTTRNSSTFWQIPNSLLFFQGGLDPSKEHSLSITNLNDGMKFSFNSITVYQPVPLAASPSSSAPAESNGKHSISLGVIIGPIVGVVIIAAAAGVLLWWWRRRRRQGASRSAAKPYRANSSLAHRRSHVYDGSPVYASHVYAGHVYDGASASDGGSAFHDTSFHDTSSAIQLVPTSAPSTPLSAVFPREKGAHGDAATVMAWDGGAWGAGAGGAVTSGASVRTDASSSRQLPEPPTGPPGYRRATASTFDPFADGSSVGGSPRGSVRRALPLQAPATPPPPPAQARSPYPQDGGVVDVETILQIIAERMDPPGPAHDDDFPDVPPPQYDNRF